jgi:hypothetical protein
VPAVDAQQVVQILVELEREGDSAFERRYGTQARDVAHEIEAALMAQMEDNLGHVLLWEQFQSTPEEVAPALVSVVRVLASAGLVLARWLDDSLGRYREATSRGVGG